MKWLLLGIAVIAGQEVATEPAEFPTQEACLAFIVAVENFPRQPGGYMKSMRCVPGSGE